MCKQLITFETFRGVEIQFVGDDPEYPEFSLTPKSCICSIIEQVRIDTLERALKVDTYSDMAYINLKAQETFSVAQIEVEAVLDIAEDGSVIGVEVFGWPEIT